ncbi:MAG: amidohydrolase family protein [Candidatus Omnitrophica bacterium]|nr:amidohydrolase family protein [Candidatus Omnitrophota bacterium]MCM8827777.1 amidohydrolase family protein [Candidatus Omnitrophota bacterium]
MKLTNGIICTEKGLKKGLDIVIKNERLYLEKSSKANTEIKSIDLKGKYVFPGFIELHTHGAGLFSFYAGRYSNEKKVFESSSEIYQEGLENWAKLRVKTGATKLYASTAAIPLKKIRFALKELEKFIKNNSHYWMGKFYEGAMLEGTFINPANQGAMNTEYVFEPDRTVFDEINETGLARLVNVPPDHGKKAVKLTEYLVSKGVSVGAGHTSATCRQFKESIEAGLKYFIHFLNGPTGNIYKSFFGGGALEAALTLDIMLELIVDGYHIAPWYIREVFAKKESCDIMAITDSVFVSQSKGVREFECDGIKGTVDKDYKYVYVTEKGPTTLYGSLATIDKVFSNLLSYLTKPMSGIWHKKHPAIPFEKALSITSACCSTNIVKMIKKNNGDDLNTGEIKNGKFADLVIGEIKGRPGNYSLKIDSVFIRGEKVI